MPGQGSHTSNAGEWGLLDHHRPHQWCATIIKVQISMEHKFCQGSHSSAVERRWLHLNFLSYCMSIVGHLFLTTGRNSTAVKKKNDTEEEGEDRTAYSRGRIAFNEFSFYAVYSYILTTP